jgi:flagellar M-ring protein FliF
MPAVLAQMPMRSKVLLGASVFAVIVVAFLLFRIASAPSYSTFMTGLAPADTGKMTAALDEKGIGYELQNNGTALAVEKARFAEAQVALAESGGAAATSGKQPGYELLEGQKLGASDFQQRMTYQRALEGELGNTIDGIEGVNGAKVQLTLPEDELFSDEETATTAAVLLGGGATQLDSNSVRGIANLMASSVQDLKPEQVTITDGTGRMLWPNSEGGAGAGGLSLASKTAAEARFSAQKEAELNAVLAKFDGKAQVKVTADLDMDQVTGKRLTYGDEGVALEETTDEETLRSQGAGGGGGAAGARPNIGQYAGAGGGGGNSNYRKEGGATKYGVDKTVEDYVNAPGDINRLGVSVMIDPSLAPQSAAIQTAISTAAGIQQNRGDTITVSELPFPAAQAEPKGSPIPEGAVGYAKYAALGLASLLFLLFVTRALRRRESDALMDEPLWLRHIEQPQPLAALEMPHAEPEAMVAAMVHEVDSRKATVEELIRKEPQKVANQVRAWVTEDE